MSTIIGIFAQQRDYDGRCYNNLAFDYVRAVESTGAIAMIIPCGTPQLEYFLSTCDGFIFPGGADIDPTLYGQEWRGAYDCQLERDRWLLDAMRGVCATQKPILGICKGMQLLNIAHGGTLIQDIGGRDHHNQPTRGYEHTDIAEIVAESIFAQIYGTSTPINSIHHQAIDTLGEGLRVSATSQHDGEIEAIEHTHLPHYGTQWHPEYLEGHRPLFHYFVSQCS